VETERMFADAVLAEAIRCESIAIVDPENPGQVLAELSSTLAEPGGDPGGKRFGRLVLTDSEGREYFGLADDLLQMREIRCEGVSVIDPNDPTKILAQLTSTQIPSVALTSPTRFGVLALNNKSYAQVFGLPTQQPVVQSQPPVEQTPGQVESGVVDETMEPERTAEGREPAASTDAPAATETAD